MRYQRLSLSLSIFDPEHLSVETIRDNFKGPVLFDSVHPSIKFSLFQPVYKMKLTSNAVDTKSTYFEMRTWF